MRETRVDRSFLPNDRAFFFILCMAAVAVQALLVILFAYKGFLLVGLIAILAVFFLITVFSVERSFYLFAAYFLIFPDKFYGVFFPGVPVNFFWSIGYLFFLVICFYWVIDLLRSRADYSLRTLDKMLLVFITSVLISALLGILRGYRFSFFRLEIMPLSLYLSYFIVLQSPLKENPRRFYDFVTLCAVLIAFEFIDSLLIFGGSIFLVRVVSMHIHMALFGISYICISLIYSAERKRKLIMGIALPVILISVVISQQRALWGATLVVLLLAFAIYIYHRREKIMTISATVLGIICFLFVSYAVLNQIFKGALYNTIITRGVVLLDIEATLADASYMIRANETVEALRTVKGDFLFGKGIGASVVTRWRIMEHATVDNSFAYVYWKMGILGLVGFFGFYALFVLRSIKLLKKSITADERIITIATLLNFAGLFVVALTNVCIVHYRFILIWAASIGFIEFIARKYERVF